MHMKKMLVAGWLAGAIALTAQGQWMTQTINLNPGWNAVFLKVQPSPATLDTVLTNTPVLSVWQWNRQFVSAQYTLDPSQLLPTDPHWLVWYSAASGMAFLNKITEFVGGASYLVQLPTNAAPVTLSIKGQPRLPANAWFPHAMSFVGFPVHTSTPPYALDFFREAESIDVGTSYDPNLFMVAGSGNSIPITAPARTRLQGGTAYWVQLDGADGFDGPIEIEGLGTGLMDFGTDLNEMTFRIVNNSATGTATATLSLHPSETPPPGQQDNAGMPPMSWFQADWSRQQFGWTNFSAPFTVTIPPGGQTDVRLGVRRAALPPVRNATTLGASFQSLLQVVDGLGNVQFHFPIHVNPGGDTNAPSGHNPYEGLWVGEALISRVNNPVPGGNDTNLLLTANTFPVRLLVHVDSTGKARLLQQVVSALDPADGSNATTRLYADESHLPNNASNVARISSAVFHFMAPTLMTGTMNSNLTCQMVLDYNDRLNPFKHLYHPEHDNMDANYTTNLPNGVESWTVTRNLTLRFSATGGNPNDPLWGYDELGGIYSEGVAGLRTKTVLCSGPFALRRVNRVNTLQ